MPQSGHATSATSSSAKPRVPAASPTPWARPMRCVTTKLTELFRNTRNAMLNSATPSRYVAAWARVAVKPSSVMAAGGGGTKETRGTDSGGLMRAWDSRAESRGAWVGSQR